MSKLDEICELSNNLITELKNDFTRDYIEAKFDEEITVEIKRLRVGLFSMIWRTSVKGVLPIQSTKEVDEDEYYEYRRW